MVNGAKTTLAVLGTPIANVGFNCTLVELQEVRLVSFPTYSTSISFMSVPLVGPPRSSDATNAHSSRDF